MLGELLLTVELPDDVPTDVPAGLRWFDTVPVLPVLFGVVAGVVVLFTVPLFLIDEVLPAVAETLVAVDLLPVVLELVATRLAPVPDSLRLILLLDVPPRVETLLVNTLSELLWWRLPCHSSLCGAGPPGK